MTSAEKIKELETQLGLIAHELKSSKTREGYLEESINNDEEIRQELLGHIKLRRDLASSIMSILKLSAIPIGDPAMNGNLVVPREAFNLIERYLLRIEEQYYVIPSTPKSTPKSKKDTQ